MNKYLGLDQNGELENEDWPHKPEEYFPKPEIFLLHGNNMTIDNIVKRINELTKRLNDER